jgi:hypothetical protein
MKIKAKVNFTLEQAMKAQKGNILYSLINLASWRSVVNATLRPLSHRE